MKFAITSLLSVSFIALAVFGFFAMDHNGSHQNCLAAFINNDICSTLTSIAELASFHLNAFQSLSQAFFSPAYIQLIFALALLFLAIGALIAGKYLNNSIALFKFLSRAALESASQQYDKFYRWLSFLINSPSLA